MENQQLIENLNKIFVLYNGIQDLIASTKVDELILVVKKSYEKNSLGKFEEVSKLIISYDLNNGTLDRKKDYGELEVVVTHAAEDFNCFNNKDINSLVGEVSLKEDEKVSIRKDCTIETFLKLCFSKYTPVLLKESLEEVLLKNDDLTKKIKI